MNELSEREATILGTIRGLLIVMLVFVGLPVCCIALGGGYILVSDVMCDIQKDRMDGWLKATYEDIRLVSEDNLIDETPPRTVIGGGPLIRGRASLIYEAEQSYGVAIADLSAWLIEKGWERNTIPNQVEVENNAAMGVTHYFYLPGGGYSRELVIAPNDWENSESEYADIYTVYIEVNDSSQWCDF